MHPEIRVFFSYIYHIQQGFLSMQFKIFNTGFPKVTIAFGVLLIIVTGNVVFNYYIIKKNRATITNMTDVINPYIEALEKFNLIVTESKMYSTNWVYLQNSVEDKKELDSLHKNNYPELKKKLETFFDKLNKQADKDSIKKVFVKFEELIGFEQNIMKILGSFDDYENPKKKFMCEDIIESEVLPRTLEIMVELNSIIVRNREDAIEMKGRIEKASTRMMTVMLMVSVGLFVFVLFFLSFISGTIRKPVLKMREIIRKLARGELHDEHIEVNKNVIGEMASSVNALSESFTRTSVFANEIGSGNLKAHYEKLGDNDLLGTALINMRESLRIYSDDMEKQVHERTEEVREKGTKLEMAYRDIRDSINYAKRIQQSILPADKMITNVFPNSFVFYQPKDVVCGDFYWFAEREEEAIIAAIDCTGHGVPGALMTVIGNSLMNQIVNFLHIVDPGEILNNLDKKLHDTLKQHGTVATADGMDAAICRYNIKKREIVYAGARRPLFIFQRGVLTEVKADKFPIGSWGNDNEKKFLAHTIKINEGDTIYMFSDGIQDQFGGSEGKKFMVKRFRDLLIDLQNLPMNEQANRLEKELFTWKKNYEQTDDMLLIGIRF